MRLIDADKIIKEVYGNPFVTDSVKTYVKCSVVDQPTIDAIEVVRCKDCIWYLKDGSCARHLKQFEPYDFCSYGERGDSDD